ncbi:hypothetical protein WMO40_03630 [Bacillaceae bacterium CLA-AA-H227]|uniref:Uncharacterized protein n=1 Tax=Robertmurraya yapensis (ex Hitch et al 2024) TaxID=3133160 RepID=A0ACC6S735_9BACI
MKITYEIKNLKEFRRLPLLSKLGIFIFYFGAISFICSIIINIFDVESNIIPKTDYLPMYCMGASAIGFIITIIFDKNRKNKTKINSTGPF